MPSTRALSLGVIALTLALAYGIWYAYSVVLVALLQEYGWSRSVLAGAFSVFTLVHGAGNPVIGTLCDRLRPLGLMAAGGVALGLALLADSYIAAPWQLYLFFGVFTAIAGSSVAPARVGNGPSAGQASAFTVGVSSTVSSPRSSSSVRHQS